MIDADTLNQLLVPVDCGISIYFPIEPKQRDERAPAARLRKVLDAAAEQMAQIDMQPDQRTSMLESLRTFSRRYRLRSAPRSGSGNICCAAQRQRRQPMGHFDASCSDRTAGRRA